MNQTERKTVLFDLDGTLLPMDRAAFTHAFFSAFSAALSDMGMDKRTLTDAVLCGVEQTVCNDGAHTNEWVFWHNFEDRFPDRMAELRDKIDAFYDTGFDRLREVCGYNPAVPVLIRDMRAAGYRLILATNPIFPRRATEKRVRWAGLSPDDFSLITTYENSRYSKPSLAYYRDILRMSDLSPETALMVGNDVEEDMVAGELGMPVFLLTDCLENPRNRDISVYPQGDVAALRRYLSL